MKSKTMKWQARLRGVATVEELISLVNAYLATLEPSEWASLPEGSRPGRLRDSDDLAYWLEVFVDDYCEQHAETSPAHRDALAFLMAAERRHKELLGEAFHWSTPQAPEARA